MRARRRLTRDGQPLIGEPVRQVITARSHGLPLYLDLSVARILELSRSGRTPQPGDFDHVFPALVSRTLSDLTPDERHVLRSVSPLDAFDVPLATRAAGLTHEGPALRLTKRPIIREDPFGLWPFHLHQLIRSAVRNTDDTTDSRWTESDWQQAAHRAFTTLGEQYQAASGPDRTTCSTWLSTTERRPTATSVTAPPPRRACRPSPTATPASPRPPAAASLISPARPVTSPPPAPWAGKVATTASKAASGGPTATWTAPPSPTPPHATKPNGVAGERATSQAQRAPALAFAHPALADDGLALAQQLLTGLDLRATTLTTRIAALVRDAGRDDTDIDDRAQVLRADIGTAGLTYADLTLDLALAFHHAVCDDHDQAARAITRLRENTRGGNCAYYSDIAHFMAGLPVEVASTARWVDGEPAARQRWHAFVTAWRDQAGISG
ncbi:hypothetical protein [Streptomyces sp. NPDC058272]|uniref:hypothetical protein n=1 Tax=unclassified Streptomyces TaxID=2593676 RepID=UPI0036E3A802